jgi:hypothetical protein
VDDEVLTARGNILRRFIQGGERSVVFVREMEEYLAANFRGDPLDDPLSTAIGFAPPYLGRSFTEFPGDGHWSPSVHCCDIDGRRAEEPNQIWGAPIVLTSLPRSGAPTLVRARWSCGG